MDLEEDEEDEILEEMDVFLSKGLDGMVHLLQYPVCDTKRKYNPDQRRTARVKPLHKKLEMDVVLDVSSPNYDQSKGEQIALNVDGLGGEGMTYDSSVMDTQVLTSVTVPLHGKRYVAALVTDGQLHCTPVNTVVQLRPGFKYMDRAEMRAAQAAKMKASAESGNSSQDEAEDAKAVSVRFKGVETEAARTARERSYAAYEKRLFAEKWVVADVHPASNSYSGRERNRMIYKANPDACSNFTEMSLSSSEYLANIVPCYPSSEVDSSTNPENILSLTNLKSMSLPDQLKAVMKNSKIIHFSHLTTLLAGSPDANSVVRSLQSFAVLVQGCWIVKSDVLYPPDTLSSISGIPSETICKARDFILSKFNFSEFLNRREVVQTVKMSGEEIKVMFEQIAVMKPGKGWCLRLPPDLRFSSKFPEVCGRQAMVWKARQKQLAKHFGVQEEEGKPAPTEQKNKNITSPKASRQNLKRSPKAKNKTIIKSIKKEPPDNGELEKQSKIGEINHTRHANGSLKIPKQEPMSPVMQQATICTKENNTDPLQQQSMEYEFSDMEKSSTFKNLLCEDLTQPVAVNNGILNPFINPSVIHRQQNDINLPESMDTNFPLFANSCNIDLQQDATLGQHRSINIDGINSTVALVADQVRLQLSSPKSCNENLLVFNGSTTNDLVANTNNEQ